jgi:hypothetical protein
MPLISVLRQSVAPKSIPSYERLVRFVAERARNDADTFKWSARVTSGSEGQSFAFVAPAESFVELTAREGPDAMIRRLYGGSDGDAINEALGEGVTSSSNVILQPREDLGAQVVQLGSPPPLAVLTRLRPTPAGASATEELIRKVIEAAAKVDDERIYNVAQAVIGDLGNYLVMQPIADPAQLDRQSSVPELLIEAFGATEGEQIFREGTAAIEDAQAELSVLREDLSNLA